MRRTVQLFAILSALVAVRSLEAANAFSLDQNAVDFGSVNAGTSPAPLIVNLTNNTGGFLSIKVTVKTQSGGPWLSAASSPNPVPPNGGSQIQIFAHSSMLQPGTYTGTVTLQGGGTTMAIGVTINISGVSISASSPVQVTVLIGQMAQFQVHVSGGPVTVQITTPAEAPWLAADATVEAPGSFSVSVDAGSLSLGPHFTSLSLQCINGSPCVPIGVSVQVTVKAQTALIASVNSLTFQAYPGRSDPPAQKLKINTNNGSPLGFTLAASPSWIQASAPTSQASSTAVLLTIGVTASGLASGANSGTVVLSPSPPNGTPDVTITVSATLSPFSISVAPNPPQAVNVAFGQTQGVQLQVNTADGAAADVTIAAHTDTGANWLTTPSARISAPAQLNVTVDASALAVGNHSGSLTFSCATATCDPVQVPFSVTVGLVKPAIKSGGVVTASSFGASPSITAGTYAEIYGSGLAGTQRVWAGTDFHGDTAPTSLDGVSVTINGQAAFVNYVSGGQVNILVPDKVGTGSGLLVLTNSGGTTTPYSVNIDALQPGLLAPAAFLINGKQYVGALFPDGSFVLPVGAISGVNSRPAKPGETIIFYGLGFGAVDPSTPIGNIAHGMTKLHFPLQILFGQTPAMLPYDGLAPGFVGLYQINVLVPAVSDNDATPLTFNLGGTPGSQTLFIAVHR